MRSFLQKKAGATYFAESNVTASIRKHNIEIIFALKGGWHAVISIVPAPEGVILLAVLGSFNDQLEKIVPKLRLKNDEHKTFTDILEGKSEYRVLNIDVDGKGLESGIGKQIMGMRKPHLQLLGDIGVHKEAGKLCNQLLDIYSDLQQSKHSDLKSLTRCFVD